MSQFRGKLDHQQLRNHDLDAGLAEAHAAGGPSGADLAVAGIDLGCVVVECVLRADEEGQPGAVERSLLRELVVRPGAVQVRPDTTGKHLRVRFYARKAP